MKDSSTESDQLKSNDQVSTADQASTQASTQASANERARSNDRARLNDQLKVLLGLCAHRDQVAFKQLYDASSSQLYATLRNILRIEAVAEEALQEVYVKVWEKASDYKPELGQPFTWMTSIARYHALDILRKRQIRENKEVEWDEELSGNESVLIQPGPAKTVEYQDILEQCFGRLSENQRECITRAYLEGLTHDELSASVNSPVGTIKSWIRRGLVTLKECVSELS